MTNYSPVILIVFLLIGVLSASPWNVTNSTTRNLTGSLTLWNEHTPTIDSSISYHNVKFLSTLQFHYNDELEVIFERKLFWEDDVVHWVGESDTQNGLLNLLWKKHDQITGSATIGTRVVSWLTLPNGQIQISITYTSTFLHESLPLDIQLDNNIDIHPHRTLLTTPTDTNDDDGRYIDIMCIYTRQAYCNDQMSKDCDIDNQTSIKEQCQLAVSETNTAFQLSGVKTNIRLVYSGLLDPYVESKEIFGCQNIVNMKEAIHPAFQQLKVLQEQYKADLVALIVNESQHCGCSFEYSGNPNHGYFMVNRKCIIGNYSFAHEIGHNLGADHDLKSGEISKGYAHGYHDINHPFRTIMSNSNCGTEYTRCPRIPRFSNPNEEYLYQGYPTGTLVQNNVKQMNEAYWTVANFQKSSERDRSTFTPKPMQCKQRQALFEFDLHTDLHPEEISWKLINSFNTKHVASGKQYHQVNTNFVRTGNKCLWTGKCYKLIIKDSQGDGFQTYGDYNMYINGELIVQLHPTFQKWKKHVFGIDSSVGSFQIFGSKRNCAWLRAKKSRKKYCHKQKVQLTCPRTCNSC